MYRRVQKNMSSERMYSKLINSLLKFECTDEKLVRTLIDTYTLYRGGNVIYIKTSEEQKPFDQEYLDWSDSLHLLGKDRKKPTDKDITRCFLQNTDLKLACVKVKYNIDMNCTFRSVYENITSFIMFSQSESELDTEHRIWKFLHSLRPKLLMMEQTYGQMNETQTGCRRMILISALLYPYPLMEQFVKFMKLYFRTIPDPLISRDEVEKFLGFIFRDSPIEGTTKDLVERIDTLFKLDKQYAPRSLQHLCRCSVRDCLRNKSRTFPALVEDLYYPQILKSYLRGEY